jgi:hypothetical protein
VPEDWKELLWSIAYSYRFSPRDIWEMDLDELYFWSDGMEYINARLNPDGR